MGGQRRRGADDLLVHPVLASRVDAHDDRLVGLVRDDDALAHLDVRLRGRLGGRRGLRTRLPGAALALLQAVRAAMLGLRAAGLGALLSALLDRPLRTRLTAVRRARLTATLLRAELLDRLGLLRGGGRSVLGGRLLRGRLLGRRSSAGGSSAGGSSAGGSSAGAVSAAGPPPRRAPLQGPPPRRAPPRESPRPLPRRRSARRPAPPARPPPRRPGRAPHRRPASRLRSRSLRSQALVALSLRISVSTSIPRWRATVSARARSCFAWRIRAVFSSCPVACWKRRLNTSCRAVSANSTSCGSSRLCTSTAFTAGHRPRGTRTSSSWAACGPRGASPRARAAPARRTARRSRDPA